MSSEQKNYELLCEKIINSELPTLNVQSISKFIIDEVNLIIQKFTNFYTIEELLIHINCGRVYLRLKLYPSKEDPFYNNDKCIHVTCYENYFGVDFENTMMYMYKHFEYLNYFWKLIHLVLYICKYKTLHKT